MRTTEMKLISRMALGISAVLLTLPPLLARAIQQSDPLSDTQWKLVVPNWGVGPRAVTDAPTLQFEGDRTIASAGCNTMSGSYKLNGETIKVEPLISTKMSCGESVDWIERHYSAALGSATKWQISRDNTILLLENGKQALVFEKQFPANMQKKPEKVALP